MNRTLEGFRVLDLTRVLAGPYATMLLADLGAEVIKIEPPPAGDGTRGLAPKLDETRSAYFVSANRGKRSLVLDLKQDAGRAILLELLETADVLVENFRPGVLDRLVLPDDELARRFPRLVVCSLSAFGSTGPDRDLPAFDLTIQARGGAMAVTGHPGETPVRSGVPIGDLSGAMFAATAICAALAGRERSGRGERIDLSLLETQAALMTYFAQYHIADGRRPGPQGSGHPSAVPYRVYATSDGHLAVGVFLDRFWPPFCEAVGRPDLGQRADLREADGRVAAREELDAEIGRLLAQRPNSFWTDRFRETGVPVAPVQDVEDVLADPQLRARSFIVPLEDPDLGPIPTLGSPFRSARDGAHTARRPPPALGADSARILEEWLGLGATRIEELRRRRVIR